jgi:hypothetical protein
MKISGVGSGAPTSGPRKTGSTDKKGSFQQALVESMGATEETGTVEAPTSLGGIDALLAVQGAGDSLEREAKRRLVQRGEDILDKLEELRHGLLMGEIPKSSLMSLAQTVRTRREACGDPRLAALLDEIELRAEVELAKLSRT